MALGVEVRTRTAPSARGAPTDTGTLFIVGEAAEGPLDAPTLVRSIADFETTYGDRTGDTIPLYDYLDAYFREGGQRAYVGRFNDTGTIDAGLALFGADLGPGQIVAVGESPGATTYGKLLDAAVAGNRFAVLDVGNGDTVAAINTLATALGEQDNLEYGMLVGPWVDIPGPSGVIGGTTRTVPASAIAAALMARVDSLGNPNVAAAGRDFPVQYGTGFTRTITDAERLSLLDSGVNWFSEVYGVLELYGFQTPVEQNDINPFWQANCSRTRMWIVAQAKKAGEGYMFKPIDGQGKLAGALKSDLDAIMLTLYQMNGLYGQTPQEAFATNVGAAVNTEASVAQGELHAVAEARLSLHAKSVLIDLVSVPVTGRVSVA
jgi:hypothetical protein